MANGKRMRGAVKNPVTPGYRIEEASREKFKKMTDAVGAASPSELLDLLARYIETDPVTGRPVWWPEDDDRGELPIEPT
ncbi:hypothetical protein C5C13_15135 [Clavibacter michiganensis]|nr:hypothetical protein C5C13_15135 [Clavibacter michiganensis]